MVALTQYPTYMVDINKHTGRTTHPTTLATALISNWSFQFSCCRVTIYKTKPTLSIASILMTEKNYIKRTRAIIILKKGRYMPMLTCGRSIYRIKVKLSQKM